MRVPGVRFLTGQRRISAVGAQRLRDRRSQAVFDMKVHPVSNIRLEILKRVLPVLLENLRTPIGIDRLGQRRPGAGLDSLVDLRKNLVGVEVTNVTGGEGFRPLNPEISQNVVAQTGRNDFEIGGAGTRIDRQSHRAERFVLGLSDIARTTGPAAVDSETRNIEGPGIRVVRRNDSVVRTGTRRLRTRTDADRHALLLRGLEIGRNAKSRLNRKGSELLPVETHDRSTIDGMGVTDIHEMNPFARADSSRPGVGIRS